MGKVANRVLILLFAAGALAALGKVFIFGDVVTNLGSYTPWGLWVSMYIYLVGLSAGAAWTGLYVAWRQGSQPNRLSTISFIVSGVSLAFGLAFIGIDLGKPMDGIAIFLHPSFSSKLTIASWLYGAFFICLAGYFMSKTKTIFMYLAGIIAAAFVLAEGLFFGGMVARTLWNGMLTPLAFFTSSITSGVAGVYLMTALSSQETLEEEGTGLQTILVYGLLGHAIVELAHVIVGLTGLPSHAMVIKNLLLSWPFLGLFVVVGLAIPLALIYRRKSGMQVLPAILILVGLAGYKYSFVRYGFSIEPLPQISAAFHHLRLSTSYVPSLVEFIVALGFLSGGLLVAQFVINSFVTNKKA